MNISFLICIRSRFTIYSIHHLLIHPLSEVGDTSVHSEHTMLKCKDTIVVQILKERNFKSPPRSRGPN